MWQIDGRPAPRRRSTRGVAIAALRILAALVASAAARPGPAWVVEIGVATAGAAELNGPAEVIDGNSLAVGGRAVRLFGIEAPDEQQVCRRGGAAWRCGQDAGWALAAKIERHWVLCDTRAAPAADAPASEAPGSSRVAPPVSAVCYLHGRRIDLNAWMVEHGWALADRRSGAYLAEEQTAQRAGRGLWSGTFEPPWEWRREHH